MLLIGQKELKNQESQLGCLEKACLEAAEQEMEDLKFKEFAPDDQLDEVVSKIENAEETKLKSALDEFVQAFSA